MRIKGSAFWASALMFLLFTASLWAGTTGKIAGTVKDKDTGAPLPGVNIVIKGTTMGAATNLSGEYFIINVRVGTYTLVATMVGYKAMEVANVRVSADLTTTVDFGLEPTVLELGEIVEVTAERAMVKREVTSSTKIIDGAFLQKMPVTSFDEVVALQAGAVETGMGLSGGLHIRGGRNDEVVYYVDGVNVNDPVTNARGVSLDNNAIAEMSTISGGFNAEFGEAMSGVVNIITKEGSVSKYGGRLEHTTDALFKDTRYDFGFNNTSMNFSGPIPLLRNKASFFISSAFDQADDRVPTYFGKKPHNDLKGQSGTAKLLWKPSNAIKIVTTGNWAYRKLHRYDHANARGNWLKDGRFEERGNTQFNVMLTHNLSKSTFYTLNLSRFNTWNHHGAKDGKGYNEWKTVGPGLDWVAYAVEQEWYNRIEQKWTSKTEEEAWIYYYQFVKGWIDRVEDGVVYWKNAYLERDAWRNRWYDAGTYDVVAETVFTANDTTINIHVVPVPFDLDGYLQEIHESEWHRSDLYRGDIDQFFPNYDEYAQFRFDFRPWWHRRNTTNYAVNFGLNSQIGKHHLFKGGFNVRKNDLELTDIQIYNANPYSDHYTKKPVDASAYLQDQISYEDMVINAGLRFDYFDPASKHYVNMDSLTGFTDAKVRYQFSPRVGISFAVSDKTVLYANYGHFFQHVRLHDLYQALEADVTSGLPVLGNPGLEPQKTISYAIGLRHSFTPDLLGELNAYYKDVTNLIKTEEVHTSLKEYPVTYTKTTTADIATIKGIDISLTKRAMRYLSATITYSYLNAKGTGSANWEGYYLYTGTTTHIPLKEYPLEFDVTHSLKANLNLYFPEGYGPEMFGFKPLSDFNTNLQLVINSGTPYMPLDHRGNPGLPGSERLPSNDNVDMRMDKMFKVTGDLKCGLFLDVRNLFDRKNVVEVDRYTGKPDDNGYPPLLEGYSYDYERWQKAYEVWKWRRRDPYNWSNPRIVRAGLTLSF